MENNLKTHIKSYKQGFVFSHGYQLIPQFTTDLYNLLSS